MKTLFPIWLIAIVFTLPGCGGGSGANPSKDNTTVDFVNDVKPILQTQCVRCHNEGAIMGGLNLMNRKMAQRGSSKGPVIVPGEPEKSPLYRVTLLPEDRDHAMPATGAKLTAEEKKILYRWIKEGADWPDGKAGAMQPIEIEVEKV